MPTLRAHRPSFGLSLYHLSTSKINAQQEYHDYGREPPTSASLARQLLGYRLGLAAEQEAGGPLADGLVGDLGEAALNVGGENFGIKLRKDAGNHQLLRRRG